MKIYGDEQVSGIISTNKRVVEGLRAQLIENGVCELSNRSEKFFRFVATEPSTVILPDATTLSGGFEFVFYTTSTDISLLDYSGTTLQKLEPGIVYYCYIMDNSTTAGEWIINMDTSYDIAVGSGDYPARGVRAYFKIESEYDGTVF